MLRPLYLHAPRVEVPYGVGGRRAPLLYRDHAQHLCISSAPCLQGKHLAKTLQRGRRKAGTLWDQQVENRLLVAALATVSRLSCLGQRTWR